MVCNKSTSAVSDPGSASVIEARIIAATIPRKMGQPRWKPVQRYFTVYSSSCINWVAYECIHKRTSPKLTWKSISNIIALPHYCTAQELHLFFILIKGNEFLEMLTKKKSLHAMSLGLFTALIKIARRRINLAVSTFRELAEEHGQESSITRGGRQGNNSRQGTHEGTGSCINLQHV